MKVLAVLAIGGFFSPSALCTGELVGCIVLPRQDQDVDSG